VKMRRLDVRSAAEAYEEVIAAYEAAGEEDLVLSVMNNLATAKKELGDLVGAGRMVEEFLERVVARGGAVACGLEEGAEGMAQVTLAELLRAQGRLEAAKSALRDGIDRLTAVHGGNHPHVGIGLTSMAAIVQQQGDYEAAITMHREALRVYEAVFGEGHDFTAMSLINLAQALLHTGDLQGAEAALDRATPIVTNTLGEFSPQMGVLVHSRGLLLKKRGQYRDAEAAFRASREIRESCNGPDTAHILPDLVNLGSTLVEMRRFPEAEAALQRAKRLSAQWLGDGHLTSAIVDANLAEVHRHMGEHSKAATLLASALETLMDTLGKDHEHTMMARGNQARVLLALGDVEGARSAANSAKPPLSLLAHAELCVATGALAESVDLYRRALAMQESEHSATHPLLHEVLMGLADALAAQGLEEEAHDARVRAKALQWQ